MVVCGYNGESGGTGVGFSASLPSHRGILKMCYILEPRLVSGFIDLEDKVVWRVLLCHPSIFHFLSCWPRGRTMEAEGDTGGDC